MKHLLLTLIMLLYITTFVQAQTVAIDAPLFGTSGNVVTGTSNYAASEAIYYDSEIGSNNFTTAATAINRIEFSVNAIGTSTNFNNFRIYMQNVPASITTFATGTYTTTGYTMVYNGSITINTTGWIGVNLSTTFIRNAGDNLQILIERADGVAHANFSFNCVNEQSAPTNTRRYNGASALSGSTQLTTSLFRASIRLKHTIPDDLSVDKIETLGKVSSEYGTPYTVKAIVSNQGTNTKPSGTVVSLNISGANSFTDTKTIATNLAPGASYTVTFNPITNLTATGNNTVSVYVPADGNIDNDTAKYNQEVTYDRFGYLDTSIAVSSIGYNAGSGFLLNKHKFSSSILITGIRAFIRSKNNTMFGVVCDSMGNIIGQTPDYTLQVADSNTYVTFNFTAPISISKDSLFYIGIAQKAGTYGYYPLGSQRETPARENTFAGISGLTGGSISFYTTLGRFMIEGIAMKSLPLTLAYFNGRVINNKVELTWATLTETNTSLFEIERLDNLSDKWQTITKIKASENSSSIKHYIAYNNDVKKGKYQYRLKMIDKDGSFAYSPIVALEVNDKNIFVLHQNYPNPVRKNTQINYQIPTEGKVIIELYNQEGKKITTLLNQQQVAGNYNVTINTTQLRLITGNYQYKIMVTGAKNELLYTATKTMVVIQ
ncbi:MAG: hypothetical protein KF781_02620 [Chitinophagaceae bacterium]|nr:hypothetical protein [Chitinophagaceae bacterium]MCW5904404.1 hypothetical protein [Chitinophagaceae bacterium]